LRKLFWRPPPSNNCMKKLVVFHSAGDAVGFGVISDELFSSGVLPPSLTFDSGGSIIDSRGHLLPREGGI